MSTELFGAISQNNRAALDQILQAGADPNQPQDGYSALLLASTLGHCSIVEDLLQAGAMVNSPQSLAHYERQWSPLIAAIANCHAAVVSRLIDAEADVRAFYNLADRPNTLDTEKVRQLLFNLGISATPLYVAVGTDDVAIVEQLIQAGGVVDAGDGADTPLNLAVSHGSLAMVQRLLAAGADVNCSMEDDLMPIMTAASLGNLPIVDCLLAAGATVNGWTQGESALSLAAQAGHEVIYERLYPLVALEHKTYATRAMLAQGQRRQTRKRPR
jgi:ankyrin repeat protein